jgi:hypothetical protein
MKTESTEFDLMARATEWVHADPANALIGFAVVVVALWIASGWVSRNFL